MCAMFQLVPVIIILFLYFALILRKKEITHLELDTIYSYNDPVVESC